MSDKMFPSGISKVDLEIKRAFDILELYGVPRERAGTVDNGIEVLVTRLWKASQVPVEKEPS